MVSAKQKVQKNVTKTGYMYLNSKLKKMNSYIIKIVQVEYNNSSLKKYQKPKYEWNLHQEILVNVLVYSQHFFFMQLKRFHKFWKRMNEKYS